jgi:ABC-type transport system involved in multi-copper enzyme maturation permease subunit
MNLMLLLQDELRHLLRTRSVVLMLSLLPPLLVIAGISGIGGGEMAPIFFTSAMGASLASVVCGAMVTSSLISELQLGTPVLFAVRPVPRFALLFARFLALVLVITAALGATLAVSAGLSAWLWPEVPGVLLAVRSGFVVIVGCAILSASLGVLIGVSASSMLGGILLYFILGINISNMVIIAVQEGREWTGWPAGACEGAVLLAAAGISGLLLAISARIFSRRPL